MLKLYHHFMSTCSRRVRICLAEKGIEWESQHVDLRKLEHLDADYVKLNPNGVVPTLDHDGRIIIESNVIIAYLDDQFDGPSLQPRDPYQRAQMHFWMDRCEHFIHRNVNTISTIVQGRLQRILDLPKDQQDAVVAAQPNPERQAMLAKRIKDGIGKDDMAFAEDRLAEAMDQLEEALQQHPWIAGETYSLADISIAPFPERFEANKQARLIDWKARPALGDWWQRMQARPGYQEAYAFPDPDLAA